MTKLPSSFVPCEKYARICSHKYFEKIPCNQLPLLNVFVNWFHEIIISHSVSRVVVQILANCVSTNSLTATPFVTLLCHFSLVLLKKQHWFSGGENSKFFGCKKSDGLLLTLSHLSRHNCHGDWKMSRLGLPCLEEAWDEY